jgi:ATP-dependent helicase/nuclease subunit B
VHPECPGRLTLRLPDGTSFTLRARADRIEACRDGRFLVIDFKTGAPPSAREVFAGFAPQLTLEAAMLMQGGFMGLPRARAAPDLLYVHTTGGRKPLNAKPLEPPRGDARSIPDLIAEHQARLEGLVARYAAGEVGYLSRPYPKFAKRFGAYDHLARVKEWSLASAGEGGEGV